MDTAIAQKLIREKQRVAARQYETGGWMIALQMLTIEIDGEPLVIPAGHHLTRAEAMNYPGDVQPAFNRRTVVHGHTRSVQTKIE